jgi:hypothetical protein
MPETVEKRSGETQPFSRDKIETACCSAGASPEEARQIADIIEASPERHIRTAAIRSRVLEELGRRNPRARDNWLAYDRSRGRALPNV